MKKYSNLFKFLKMNLKYKKLIFAALILMITYSLSAATLPRISMEIIDYLTYGYGTFELKELIILLIVVAIIQVISKFISDYTFCLVGQKVFCEIKLKIINKLFKLNGKYLSNLNVGEHLNILDVDTNIVEETTTKTLFSIVSDLITSFFMILMLFTIQSTLVVYVVIIEVSIILMQFYFNKRVIKSKRKIRKSNGEITNVEQELLNNFITIIQICAKSYFMKKFINKIRVRVKENLKLDLLFGMNNICGMCLNSILTVFILVYGAYKISLGEMTVGGLITFSTYSNKIIAPILRIIRSNLQIQQSLVSVDKIFKLLELDTSIHNGENLNPEINGLIKFSNVEFFYNSNSPVIKYDNITLYPNSINIITGRSGIGKSTITKLFYRMWDVNEGNINLDGNDLVDYNLNYLRSNLGTVPQENVIFSDTVYNNLTLGDTSVKKEEIYEICRLLGLQEVIMNLPEKYETILGADGTSLSGGQVQRLGIARALIRKSKVLIMDEPTSSLDENLEKDILDNINEILRERTTIIITHRKGPVKYGDYVYDVK